jgi:hypothetical protein
MFYAQTSPEFFIVKSTKGFRIDSDRVPEYISDSVARDLLFAGTAVSMLGDRTVEEDEIQVCVNRVMACVPSENDYCYAWKSVEFQSAVSKWKSVVSDALWEKVVVGDGILDHLNVCVRDLCIESQRILSDGRWRSIRIIYPRI